MNPIIKDEPKEEFNMDGAAPTSSMYGVSQDISGIGVHEPGALYTCGNCAKEIFLTAGSPMQCPSCEHLTGSSSVFYKIRTQATTYDTI